MTFQKKVQNESRPRVDLNQTTNVTGGGNPTKPQQRKRVPVDIPHNPLEYPKRDGYHRHIFNDKPGRLERAMRGGYQFVTKDQIPGYMEPTLLSNKGEVDNRVSWVVGQEDNGAAIRGYLMELLEADYQVDQNVREGKTLTVLNETLRQDQSAENPGRDEIYPTAGGVKFERNM